LYRESKDTRVPRWGGPLSAAMNAALFPFPFLRRWIGGTIANRIGQVDRLQAAGKPHEAFELALKTAPACVGQTGIFAETNIDRFWVLAAQAALLADTDERRVRVAELVKTAPGPGGLSEARTLDEISRWRWQAGHASGAIQTARAAVAADPSWPHSHLTLAFYLNEAKLGDPVPVLVEAVRADEEAWPLVEKNFAPELAAAVRAVLGG
jgi:hypothetical protein